MFKVCRYWIFAVSVIFIAFGLFMAFFNQSRLFHLFFSLQIDPVFWGNPVLPIEARTFQKWIYGVLGATCAGWGTLLAVFILKAFPLKKPWVWQSLFLSLTVWLLIDTAISWHMNVSFNVIFNMILALSVFIPLLIARKYFFDKASDRTEREGR